MVTLSLIPDCIRNIKTCCFIKTLWREIKLIHSMLKKFLSPDMIMRLVPLLFMICFIGFDSMAQTGAGGFASATTTIQSYQTQVSNLMKAVGAVIAIVGAFNVFFKMQNGDQDVKKTIMLTIGGCIAFVALGEALPMFFE